MRSCHPPNWEPRNSKLLVAFLQPLRPLRAEFCYRSWDDAYALELDNFSSTGDEGEVWFGEDSLYRVLRWFQKNEDVVSKEARILDVGCGNGVTCVHLVCSNQSRFMMSVLSLIFRRAGSRGLHGCDWGGLLRGGRSAVQEGGGQARTRQHQV